MNFDDVQKTWRSPHNQPSAAQLESDKMKFLTDLRKRNRGAVIFMIWICAVLTFLTGKIILLLLWPAPGTASIDLSREWSVVLLLGLPWLCLWVFFKKYRRYRSANAAAGRSIGASLRALLDENELACSRQKWAALLAGAALVLMPLIVYQLRAVGKAGDEILVPALVMLPALMLCVHGGLWWHRRRVLLPRRRELEKLLATYADESR